MAHQVKTDDRIMESLACPFNNKHGCFLKQNFKDFLTKQSIFFRMGMLSSSTKELHDDRINENDNFNKNMKMAPLQPQYDALDRDRDAC